MSMVYTITLVFVFVGGVLLSGIIKLSTLKLRRGQICVIPGNLVPDECIANLVEAEKFLRRSGFLFQAHVYRDAVMQGTKWGLYGSVYFEEKSNTWALAYLEPVQHAVFRFRLYFVTPCSDTKVVCTTSGGEFSDFEMPAPFIIHDPLVYLPHQQLESHRQKVASSESSTPSEYELREALDAFEFIHFQGLVEASVLVKWGDAYRLPFRHAIRVARRYKYVLRELIKQKMARESEGQCKHAATNPVGRLADDIRSYQTYRDIKDKNTMGWAIKTVMLLASVLVFGVSFGLSLSVESVLILIIVLLVHEAGHLLGMWLFGYKDLNMLFVPFMGALASGKKEQVKAWQETVVLLLGPLPGYVAGIMIVTGVFGAVSEWVYQFGVMALILNLFNMLPFMPLDGGKIINLALFSRFPRAQVVFMSMSIAVFFYIGFVWDLYAFIVIAILLAVGMPSLIQEARLLRAVLQNKSCVVQGVEDLIKVLDGLPAWKRIPQAKRWLLLDSMRNKVQHHALGFHVSLLIIGGWTFSVFGPPYFSVSADARTEMISIAAGMFGYIPEPLSIEELKEQYQNTNDKKEKAELAFQLVARHYADVPAEGEGYLEDVKALVDSADLSPETRADYYERIAGMCELYKESCAVEYLRKAIDIYRTSDRLVGEALIPLYGLASIGNQAYRDRVGYIEELNAVIESTDKISPWLSLSHLLRARIEYEQGNFENVERWLLKSVDVSEERSEEAADSYWKSLVSYYYEQGKLQSAIKTAQRWVDARQRNATATTTLTNNPEYVLAWLYSDTEPERAGDYLDGIQVQSAAEKLELALAALVIDSRLAPEASQVSLPNYEGLISDVDEQKGWYLLRYRVIDMTAEYKGPSAMDTFDARQLMLDQHWYGQLAKLLERPEFASLAAKIRGSVGLVVSDNEEVP